MITLEDLESAIAECQGERNPNSKTCTMLAAFYTIKDHMYPEAPRPEYSYSAGSDTTDGVSGEYGGGTGFSSIITKTDQGRALSVLEELLGVIQVINPKLYDATIEKLQG